MPAAQIAKPDSGVAIDSFVDATATPWELFRVWRGLAEIGKRG